MGFDLLPEQLTGLLLSCWRGWFFIKEGSNQEVLKGIEFGLDICIYLLLGYSDKTKKRGGSHLSWHSGWGLGLIQDSWGVTWVILDGVVGRETLPIRPSCCGSHPTTQDCNRCLLMITWEDPTARTIITDEVWHCFLVGFFERSCMGIKMNCDFKENKMGSWIRSIAG